MTRWRTPHKITHLVSPNINLPDLSTILLDAISTDQSPESAEKDRPAGKKINLSNFLESKSASQIPCRMAYHTYMSKSSKSTYGGKLCVPDRWNANSLTARKFQAIQKLATSKDVEFYMHYMHLIIARHLAIIDMNRE